MTIFLSRYKIDRKKDKLEWKETTHISGKNARDVMKQFNELKNVSDLFSFTVWSIYNITDD